MKMAKFVPVERGHRVEAAKASIAAAGEALRSGLNMIVFPEGTRSKDGRLQAFKKGPFFLAEETGAPIVPIAISGTQHMMRKGSFAVMPGLAKVEFLPVIEPRDYATRDALMAAVKAAIDAALPGEMKAAAG
jgi:1-acyl-sn-glycerol-3-phosphate acyltransferase